MGWLPSPSSSRSGAPLLGAATLLAALAWMAPVAADEGAPERALKLHDEARVLYAAGHYREAVERLEEAVRLDPSAKLLYYNLGLIQEKLGDLDAALAHYHSALELEKDGGERDKLEATIRRIEGARSRHEVAPKSLQAAPPPPPPPSSVPEPEPSGITPWIWVTGAAAVTSLTVAVVLASRAQAVDPGDRPVTSPEVSLEQLERDAKSAHDLAIGADVAFAIAGAATVATIVVALVDAAGADSAAGALPRVALGPFAARLDWRF